MIIRSQLLTYCEDDVPPHNSTFATPRRLGYNRPEAAMISTETMSPPDR